MPSFIIARRTSTALASGMLTLASAKDPSLLVFASVFILSQKSRRTIVISSHNLEDVERLCTHVAVIGKGKLKKFDTLQSITQGAARIVYELSSKPGNVKRFSELVDGATFSFDEEKMSLECSLDNCSLGVAEVNRVVIPEILKETDIVTISKGQTLEEAFLHGRRA